MFGGAVLIMAPLVLLSLVMTVLLGLMAKALPRSPILFLGFPLRIMMGLVGLILFLPYLMERIAVFLQGSVRLAVGAWQG